MNKRRVAFIDNGVVQRPLTKGGLRGELFLKALVREQGGIYANDLGISPFFWVELGGHVKAAIDGMDRICERLPTLERAEDIQNWLVQSAEQLFRDDDALGQQIASNVSDSLGNALDYFVPEIREVLLRAWNNTQQDCSFQQDIIRHLAIDRLAVRLSSKYSAAFRADRTRSGVAVIATVGKLLAALPGIGPYRLVTLVWDAVHYDKRFVATDRYNLREKSDLLDNDLVCRSVLALAPNFVDPPLIFTSNKREEFMSRRTRLVSTCLLINDWIQEMGLDKNAFKTLNLVTARVCFFANDNAYEFLDVENGSIESKV